MKIHIVQKGDTLWNIAKKYNVSFEGLKAVNTQLSNPDMIMPGMKIKVPSQGAGKKEVVVKESVPKQQQHPYSEKKQQAPKVDYQPVVPKQKPIMMHPEVDIHQTYNVQLLQAQAPHKPQPQPQPQPQYTAPTAPPNFPMPEMPKAPVYPKEEMVSPIPENLPQGVMPQMTNEMCYPVSPVMPGDGFDFPVDPTPQVQGAQHMPYNQPQVQGAHTMPYPHAPGPNMMPYHPHAPGPNMMPYHPQGAGPEMMPYPHPQIQGDQWTPYQGFAEQEAPTHYPENVAGVAHHHKKSCGCGRPHNDHMYTQPGMNPYGNPNMNQYSDDMYGNPGMYGNQGMDQFPQGTYGNPGMDQFPQGMYGNPGMDQFPQGMYGNPGMDQFPQGMYGNPGMDQFPQGMYGSPGMNQPYGYPNNQGMPRYNEEDRE